MSRTVEYERFLADGIRVRHGHVSRKGRILSFVVQLEVYYNNAWRPVMRFDSAHGYCHLDQYDRSGRQRKVKLDMTREEALTFADASIRRFWKDYVDHYMKGES